MTPKEKAREKRLFDNYKLTPELYDCIDQYQDHKCYVCGKPEPVPGRKLSVDHDWLTGLIRGLLCSRCNPILGKIERAFIRFALAKCFGPGLGKWVHKMGEYLTDPPAIKALGAPFFGYKGQVGTKAHRARVRKERKATQSLENKGD